MPAKQKSLFVLEKQGPFTVQESDIPKPGPGELLVEVHAASLNPVDFAIQAYGIPDIIEKYPTVLGLDAAGIVKELGDGVTSFAVGDSVCVATLMSLHLLLI